MAREWDKETVQQCQTSWSHTQEVSAQTDQLFKVKIIVTTTTRTKISATVSNVVIRHAMEETFLFDSNFLDFSTFISSGHHRRHAGNVEKNVSSNVTQGQNDLYEVSQNSYQVSSSNLLSESSSPQNGGWWDQFFVKRVIPGLFFFIFVFSTVEN